MDPIQKFPVEVVEIILGKLSGNDLLQSTLVSKSWNKLISSSPVCMANVTLALRGDWMDFNDESLEILLGGRAYQHLLVSEASKHKSFLKEIMNINHKWKSVRIYGMTYETSEELYDFIKILETSVETLVLSKVHSMTYQENHISTNVCFARLKSLTLAYCELKICSDLLRKCPNVEVLHLTHVSQELGTSFDIHESFKMMKKLKKLKVCPEWFNIMTSFGGLEGSKGLDYPFKLEVFSMTSFSIQLSIQNHVVRERLYKFLGSQAGNLVKMNLGEWCSSEIMRLTFEMKTLKELEFYHVPWNAFEWNANLAQTSIEKLRIATVCIIHDGRMKAVLSALPNLREVHLRSIDETIATFLKNFKHLKRIQLVHRHEKKIEAILPDVEWI